MTSRAASVGGVGMTKNDKPSEEQPADGKLSREDEARQVAQEYANEQRKIIKRLGKPTN